MGYHIYAIGKAIRALFADRVTNIEMSIRFSIIFNCVGGVIAWAADIYKYVSNTIYTPKPLHRSLENW